MKTYEKLAAIIKAEGIRSHFTLLGDANMHFAQTLADKTVKTIHVRHEHNACSMAMSYALASGEVGFCSVTCGPGLTQLMTALPAAVRARIPLVVFAGESPLHAAWYNQAIDQGPFVAATGARYVPLHSLKQMPGKVREAFLLARRDRLPVVIGVPMDLQKQEWTDAEPYIPSTAIIGPPARPRPDGGQVEAAAELVERSERIIILAGRGAYRSGAAEACRQLAETCGALLATTLPVRGLFHDDPHCLGIAGGFSTPKAREIFAKADLIIGVGASMAQHTRDGGKLFPNARAILIDTDPKLVNQGAMVADVTMRGDARAGIDALGERLTRPRDNADWRRDGIRGEVEADAASLGFAREPGVLNPDEAIAALDRVIPKNWEMVNSSGHCSYFAAHMFGRKAENFHTIREFGAIGNGLAYAMGVAVARPDTPVVLFDGDGSFLMHVQELETIKRHRLNILICVLNDGAYGSEIHKLRADGLSEEGAAFGRGDLGKIARGFQLHGCTVTELGAFSDLLKGFEAGEGAAVWDIHISDRAASPVMNRAHPPKAG